jgi:hypothetical protein
MARQTQGEMTMLRAFRNCLFICGLAAGWALGGAPNSAAPDSAALRRLEEKAGLDRDAIARLEAGQVISQPLDTGSNSEIAVLGAVIVAIPVEYYLQKFRDIQTFQTGPGVLQVGRLNRPPVASDLSRLNLTASDVEELEACRPGACGFKLTADMMAEIRAGLARSERAGPEAELLFRSALTGYLRKYESGGNGVLACYQDEAGEPCMDQVLNSLLAESGFLRGEAPGLYRDLVGKSSSSAAGRESFLYWSEEKLGPLKPTVTVTESTIVPVKAEGIETQFVASKQIYASHYFRGSLGLTVLAEAGPGRTLVLYINRSRTDGLSGWLGGFKRSLARHRVLGGMREHLLALRTRLEASYRAAGKAVFGRNQLDGAEDKTKPIRLSQNQIGRR